MSNDNKMENQAQQAQLEQLEKIRHSISHLMSMAVSELYPKVGLGVGPFIENGFYQDYDLPESFSEDMLPKIQKRIKKLISQNIEFKQHAVSFKEALKLYKHDPYKTELIEELKKAGEKDVSFYKSDWFENLCKGPHVKSTKEINVDAFKLTKVAGSYWRGDEKNKMLTRIYGVAFASKQELDDYLAMMAEAEKRDHRKLGKELGLFVFSDLVGKGLPLLTAKGATIRRELERFIVDEEIRRGYQHVITPPLAKVDLYKTSGHYPYYKDTMYPIMKIDEEELILRPMTCPHHFMLYKSELRSYRELPVRYAEISPQFRYEKSGELSGLIRVRMFMLADAHIICSKEQAKSEIMSVLDLIDFVNQTLGLKKGTDYRYRLSLGNRQDENKYYKDDQSWDKAETVLKEVLTAMKAPFYEAENEAAFYGPKIDVQMKNIHGKEETAFTVQYDFVMPKRFKMCYTGQSGKEEEPIVIHRSSLGCFERTMAFLIERYGGEFPLWLSPVQIKIISVGSTHEKHCLELAEKFKNEDIRIEADLANETVGNKIRKAVKEKIPYLLVIGDMEMNSTNLKVRVRGQEKLLEISYDKFIEMLKNNIIRKSLTL